MASHSQVAHLWANQSKQHAKGSSMYFEGAKIFSWGPHFCIARFIENKKGEKAILFALDDYSVSTAKHKTEVRRAIPDNIPVFTVPFGVGNKSNALWGYHVTDQNVNEHKANLGSYLERAAEERLKGKRARKYGYYHLDNAIRLIEEAQRYAKFVGIRFKSPDLQKLEDEARERYEQDKEARKQEETRAKERAAKRREEQRKDFEDWLNGNRFYGCPSEFARDENGSAYVRVIEREGQKIAQTSMGAEVPLEDAHRAFSFVKLCKENAQRFDANGRQVGVGGFAVRWIDETGNVQIGCHYFTWERVLEFATRAGFAWIPASEIAVKETHTA